MGDMADWHIQNGQMPWDGTWDDDSGRMRYIGPGECPRCGETTILRHGPYGRFWGCTRFPECRGTRNWED